MGVWEKGKQGGNVMGKLLFYCLGIVVMLTATAGFAQEDWEEEELLDIVSGKVTAIDLSASQLTIADTAGETQEFILDTNLTTVWDDTADEEKELSDLVVGKDVVVEFKVDKDGKKVASWIDIVMETEGGEVSPIEQ